MSGLTLGHVLAPAEGLLLPLGRSPDAAALEAPVKGIELYQSGVPADYTHKLVIVTVPVASTEALEVVRTECALASALIFHSDIPDTIGGITGKSSDNSPGDSNSDSIDVSPGAAAPALLRRSPWVTTDALFRALTVLTRTPDLAGRTLQEDSADTLERDAALAVHRRESALITLLRGTSDAALPAALLGLRPDQDHIVIAAGTTPAILEPLQLAVHAEFPDARAVFTESTLFVVLPLSHSDDSDAIASRLRTRVSRSIRPADDPAHNLAIAVGHVVPGVYSLHESAAGAREILRALRFKLGTPQHDRNAGVRVAVASDVADPLSLIRAGDALRPHGRDLAAPLTLLAHYDREHQTDLLPTVLIALQYRNNISEAARHLRIHANSVRARLERIEQVSGIDLAEPVSTLRAIVAFLANPDIHNTASRMRPPPHIPPTPEV